MKTFNKIAIALAMVLCLAALAPQAKAQLVTMSTTTLGAAVSTANCSQATFVVASSSTMQGLNTQNAPQTVGYVDKEVFYVNSVTDSTHIVVNRCKGIGASVIPRTHANGATIWFANATAPYPAPSLGFRNEQVNAEFSGSCTASTLLTVPQIFLWSGDRFDCLGSLWVETDKNATPVLASATVTIPAGVFTPTGTIMITDTGTNAMTGITVPNGANPGFCLTFVPGGAFTTTNATNIRIASTAVAGKALVECWDGTKWDPSY